jgi:hypothetical protein
MDKMEKQRWEESEKRRFQKRRSHKKEDQRRKKKEVEKHCVFSNVLCLRRVEK